MKEIDKLVDRKKPISWKKRRNFKEMPTGQFDQSVEWRSKSASIRRNQISKCAEPSPYRMAQENR